jgi:hypothetical protein
MTNKISVNEIRLLQNPASIENDNIDVIIGLSNGEFYNVSFFTLKNIQSIMFSYEETGECASGKYFWAKNMLIVQDLSEETIREAIVSIVESGEYENCFGEPVQN